MNVFISAIQEKGKARQKASKIRMLIVAENVVVSQACPRTAGKSP